MSLTYDPSPREEAQKFDEDLVKLITEAENKGVTALTLYSLLQFQVAQIMQNVLNRLPKQEQKE